LKVCHTHTTKNKFRLVDVSIEIPKAGDLNFAMWESCNNLVHSRIVNSKTPFVAESIIFRTQLMCGTIIRISICEDVGFLWRHYNKKLQT
jgi:hypothetical protein